ncbi:MAG: glycerol kinase, partial [Mycoplasmataceae bacterium]|nr:glycerol kinase [Mycoplasmataceae bacterium]
GAPYWDSYSRGAIFGLERGTKREHIVKATVEAIAYQSNDLISAMENDMGKKITLLRVDGGAANSNYLMQFQSSISNVKIERPEIIETTALGATYMAGLYVGYWKNIKEIEKNNKINKVFEPNIDKKTREKLIKGWDLSIKKTLNWTKDLE